MRMHSVVFAIITFGIYLKTVCPTVYLGDSGELTAAAFSLGIPHPSGYPLYSLLGKIYCLIPMGNIAFRLNLMSASFAALTVWMVASFIKKTTNSGIASFAGALTFAFLPTIWSLTVSAEVYTLHTFFIVLLIRLLWWWDQKRDFFILVLLCFVAGLSFTNHLQTVMLSPAIFFIIISGDRSSVLKAKSLFIISFFFLFALTTYIYLPIRTMAEAAIHWGDPDNLDRLVSHISGKSHRSNYVLNMTNIEYFIRIKETVWLLVSQFGIVILLSLWGWLKVPSNRWQIFFVLVVFFDLFYTVFLNTISLQITPFNLSTYIVCAVLLGFGVSHIIRLFKGFKKLGKNMKRIVQYAFCVIPVISLISNMDLCNQSRNFTAYENCMNVFRTAGLSDILITHGDNYVFPATYGRLVERAREDIELYDRVSIIFKMPNAGKFSRPLTPEWVKRRDMTEREMIRKSGSRSVFYAVFSPYSLAMPDQYRLVPYGILHRVVSKDISIKKETLRNVWKYYSSESYFDNFERDLMNRQICAFFHFSRGKFQFSVNNNEFGIKNLKIASEIGFDDDLIHPEIAIFLIDHGYMEAGREELEKSMIYHEDLSGVYNNWGYYYEKIGDYSSAITSLRKAIDLNPDRVFYYNNLGYVLFKAGKRNESVCAFQKSLAMDNEQPEIKMFLKKQMPNIDCKE